MELLIRTNRLPEAAFLARTYLPSQVSRVVKLWRENLAKVNQKVSLLLFILGINFTSMLTDYNRRFCLFQITYVLDS